MEVPPKHPFIDGFSIINQHVGVLPFEEPQVCIQLTIRMSLWHYGSDSLDFLPGEIHIASMNNCLHFCKVLSMTSCH